MTLTREQVQALTTKDEKCPVCHDAGIVDVETGVEYAVVKETQPERCNCIEQKLYFLPQLASALLQAWDENEKLRESINLAREEMRLKSVEHNNKSCRLVDLEPEDSAYEAGMADGMLTVLNRIEHALEVSNE